MSTYTAKQFNNLLQLIDTTIIECQDQMVDTTATVLVEALDNCNIPYQQLFDAILNSRQKHNNHDES